MSARREVPDDPPPFEGPRVLASERLYDSAWVGLRRDHLRYADGHEQDYHVVEIPDAVVAVPVRRDGRIVMIGQYRYPHGRTLWEVPAGRTARGEAPEDAARREVREETGHEPGRLVRLPGFYAANGISAHYAHAFVARDCRDAGPQELDRSERILVRVFERGEVEALLDAGRIEDAFTALALAYGLRLGAL